MIIKKGTIAVPSLAAVTLGVSSAVFAAPPTNVNFDEWTVSDGDITLDQTCPTGYTCGNTVSGKGFYQDTITDTATGASFFRTIITEKDSGVTAGSDPASDPENIRFFDENYVSMDNKSGISDKSVIHEVSSTTQGTFTITDTFVAETALETGYAAGNWTSNPDQDKVTIYQGVDQIHTGSEDFRTDFWLDQLGKNAADGKHMIITGSVGLDDTTGGNQDFVLVERAGTFAFKNGSITDLGDNSPGLSAPFDDNDLTWSTGDDVQAVWIGQNLDVISQDFGFTSYENKTTPDFVDDFSLAGGADDAPLQWDTSFWGGYTAPAPGDSYPPAGW